MNRGEIWWVEHPEAACRPCLILTRQAAIPHLRALLTAPATRTIRDIPTEVRLGPEDGMPAECALSLDNLTLVRKAYFIKPICRLDPVKLHAACGAIAIAVDC